MQRQLTTIEAGLYPELLQRLIECVTAASNNAAAAVPSVVAALAALAVQWKDWTDPLDTLGECQAVSCCVSWSLQQLILIAFD